MDEKSYDDTDPTPVPQSFRPPPPATHPRPTPTASAGQSTPNKSLLEQNLFSFTIDEVMDPTEESLPSLQLEQPSPFSKPSTSLFDDDDNDDDGDDGVDDDDDDNDNMGGYPRHQLTNKKKPTTFRDDQGRSRRRSSQQRQKPPMEEVRLDNEEDTFFECLEDGSMASRTRRALSPIKAFKPRSSRPSNRTPSFYSRSSEPSVPEEKQDPSSEEVVRVHQNALNAIVHLKEELANSQQRNANLEEGMQKLVQEFGLMEQTMHMHRSGAEAQMNESAEMIYSLRESNESLKVQLEEMNAIKAQLAEINTLKTHLDEMNTVEVQLEELKKEKEEWEKEKQEMETKLWTAAREKKENMHRKLAAENRQKAFKTQLDALKSKLETLTATNEELESELLVLREEKARLEEENESLTKKLENVDSVDAKREKAMSDSDSTIQKLKAEIELKEKTNTDLSQALKLTKEELQAHQAAISDQKTSHESLRENYKASQEEVERLKNALQGANQSLQSLRAEAGSRNRSSLRSPSSPSRKSSSSFSSSNVRFHTEGSSLSPSSPSRAEGATLENSIVDRLARMRDSAERAQLIRAHKRDMTRTTIAKDAEMKKLISAHDEAMRKAARNADMILNQKLDELKKSLQHQHEEQLEEIEKRHAENFEKMQQEFMRGQEAADESLRAALSKVASTTQQFEREAIRREKLERTVDKVNQQADRERKELQARHLEELEKRKAGWEMERDTLLTMIQKDCNSTFERHKKRPTTTGTKKKVEPIPLSTSTEYGPTSIMDDDNDYFSTARLSVDTGHNVDDDPLEGFISSTKNKKSPSLISPAYSDIDSVLRETEDLIQSIM